VARRQRHRLDLAGVPRADDEPARIGILFDLRDHAVNLVEAAAVRRAPVAPLRAIDAAEVAGFLVRPFVPDGHAALLQPAHIRLAAQEPEQLVDDGLEMQLLGGEHGKAVTQIKPRLRAEHGISARARAVGLELAVVEDMPEQIVIRNHRQKI
jgi:hypothetical protein